MDKSGVTPQALKEHIKDILHFMERSSGAYDDLVAGEAVRLAICLRALLDDTGGEPLVSMAGLAQMHFFDESPDYDPKIGLPFSGLAIVTLGGPSQKYKPRLMNNYRWSKKVSFDEWWNKAVIVDEDKDIRLTRRDIVLRVSQSKVGLFERRLTGEFERLGLAPALESSGAMELSNDSITLEYASVRQIAYEALKSFSEQYPELTLNPDKNN